MESRPAVLVVEDQPELADIFSRWLSLRGCRAISADTVAAGIAALRPPAPRPDAVLLDLMLPDGDGAAVLAFCLSLADPPRVVVHSGSCDGPRSRQLYSLGASAVISKPADFADLWAALFPSPAESKPRNS